MSSIDFLVAVVALACFFFLWWCRSISRRVGSIERYSKVDSLTGLGTGHWLETERWRAALWSGRPLGVVYLDLDHLKLTNDSAGHAAGDLYIKEAAAALTLACRRGVDEVFRHYNKGDEFVILLHGSLADPACYSRALLERLQSRGVMASLALAYTTETGYVPKRVNLLALAEAGCRQAKKRGGNCALVIGSDDDGAF